MRLCAAMDGEKRNMDELFSNGQLLPPAHPSCRCAVEYEEISGTNLTGGAIQHNRTNGQTPKADTARRSSARQQRQTATEEATQAAPIGGSGGQSSGSGGSGSGNPGVPEEVGTIDSSDLSSNLTSNAQDELTDGENGLTGNGTDGIIKLTANELNAVTAYISSESYKINAALREGRNLTNEQLEIVHNLDSALNKVLVYTGVVYRSITTFNIDDIDQFLAEYEPNKILEFPSYTSSGTQVYDESFPIQYIIQSKTGRDIRPYNPLEFEILFPRKTKFRVTRVEGTKIYLEEV